MASDYSRNWEGARIPGDYSSLLTGPPVELVEIDFERNVTTITPLEDCLVVYDFDLVKGKLRGVDYVPLKSIQ